VQISLNCEIDAKLRHRTVLKVASSLKAVRCGSDALESGDLRRQETLESIYESGCESGGIQRRACFQQYAQYFAVAKFRDKRFAQVGLLATSRYMNDFDSGATQRPCFGESSRSRVNTSTSPSAERTSCDRSVEAQGRIHYHSQQFAPPRQSPCDP